MLLMSNEQRSKNIHSDMRPTRFEGCQSGVAETKADLIFTI